MKDIIDLYNNAYKNFTPDYFVPSNMGKIDHYLQENTQTLRDFLSKYKDQFDLDFKFQSSSCLELGCGIGSLSFFLEQSFHSVTALDFSPLAIAHAKTLKSMKSSHVKFLTEDITQESLALEEEFDFIIDSHLFHCLTDEGERRRYVENIKSALAENGVLILETMVFNPELRFPIGYSYDEHKTLWIDEPENNRLIPIRKISTAREIEAFFLECGLKIEYLFYHNELSFCPYPDFPNHPIEQLPKTLRLCMRLA